MSDPPDGWTWLGYRRWLVSERGRDIRGNGPRPLMDQRYRVTSHVIRTVATDRGDLR